MKVLLGFLQLCILFNAIRTVHSSAATVESAGTSESKAIPKERTFIEKLDNLGTLVDRGFRSVGSDIKTLSGKFDALERRCKPVATTQQPDVTTKTEACGDWWTQKGTRFFSFCTCTQRCSFNSAREMCREKQAELAKCNSLELENFFALSLNTPTYILLGGNDLEDEGTWRWPDGSLLNASYTNWNPGQPNGGKRQNCMEWYYYVRKWYDKSCDDRYSAYDAGFVCEKKLQ